MSDAKSNDDAYAVSASSISVRVAGSKAKVLNDLSFSIPPGEFVSIIGLNGAGKSTLLRCIAGEQCCTEGTIKVAGQRVNKPIANVVDRVGIVHQFPHQDLIDHLSVAQNIAIRQILSGSHPNRIWGVTNEYCRNVAGELARANWEATQDVRDPVARFSGGEKQALNVVIAIRLEHRLNPCRLLLLDEHTSALDHTNSESVMQYTAKEARFAGCTTIMVTHRYQHAFDHSDRIIILRSGRICEDVRKADVKDVTELISMIEGKKGAAH